MGHVTGNGMLFDEYGGAAESGVEGDGGGGGRVEPAGRTRCSPSCLCSGGRSFSGSICWKG